jgi:Family of unknown function (DUF5906)
MCIGLTKSGAACKRSAMKGEEYCSAHINQKPVEEPAVEEPAVEEPAVEEPAVEEPAVEEPAVEEPAVEEPAGEEPAEEKPVVKTCYYEYKYDCYCFNECAQGETRCPEHLLIQQEKEIYHAMTPQQKKQYHAMTPQQKEQYFMSRLPLAVAKPVAKFDFKAAATSYAIGFPVVATKASVKMNPQDSFIKASIGSTTEYIAFEKSADAKLVFDKLKTDYPTIMFDIRLGKKKQVFDDLDGYDFDEPAVKEPINIAENNVASDIDEATPISMPPQQRDDTSIDVITNNAEKQRIFTYSVIGNVKLSFNDGKKKILSMTKWKDLSKSETITGPNFFIRTGKVSLITVFDVDIKPEFSGKTNLLDVDIDFDEYKDSCIIVRTQSGGFHYIFKYDSRFKTGANCYGVKGFDIRNDDAIIFAGERYDIISMPPNGMQLPPDNLYDTLSVLEEKPPAPAATTNIVSSTPATPAPVASSDGISEKYHELLKLLPDSFFRDHDKWVKPIYALKNEIAAGKLNNDEAFATANKLFMDRSGTSYDEKELTRVWGLDMKDREKRFTMGSIVKLLKDSRFDDWSAWNDKWFPKVQKLKTKTPNQIAKEQTAAAQEEYNKKRLEMLEALSKAVKAIDPQVIREYNGIEANDLLMECDSTFTVDQLALLIRQTIIRTENNGEPSFFVKTFNEVKYKRERVQSIRFEPRQIGSMKQYHFTITHKDLEFEADLLELLDTVKRHINHKRVVVEPYGAFEKDLAHKKRLFNLFSGFVQQYDKDFKYDPKIVDVWTNHIKDVLAKGDMKVYDHLMYYFKHILVNPMDKTGLVVIVKGLQGSGKNSAFDIFYRHIIGPSLSLTTPNMDLIAGRFNSMAQSLICCCLDEAVDNKDKAAMSRFKSLITADDRQIENKGKDAFTVSDFNNYVVISNNDFASFIEESDRRALCLETSNDKKGDNAYFKRYWDTLGNNEAGKHLFHYLLNEINIPEDWRPQDVPRTEYKQELKQMQSSSPVKFLLHKLEELVEQRPDENIENPSKDRYTASQLWDMYKSFCENRKHRIMSDYAFYKVINPFFPKDGDNKASVVVKGIKYKIMSEKTLRAALKNYL